MLSFLAYIGCRAWGSKVRRDSNVVLAWMRKSHWKAIPDPKWQRRVGLGVFFAEVPRTSEETFMEFLFGSASVGFGAWGSGAS